MGAGWQSGGGCLPHQGSSCTQPQLIARSDIFPKETSYLSFLLKLTTNSDFFFFAAQHVYDLSSPSRDRTRAPCSGNAAS